MIRGISIEGIKLTPIDKGAMIQQVAAWIGKTPNPVMLTFLNAYVYCLARKNPELRSIIEASEIVVPDGVSIVWASWLLRKGRISRLIMTHVFDAFLLSDHVPDCKALLIGTTDAEVQEARRAMNAVSRHVEIVHAVSGFETEAYYTEVFHRFREVDLVFIGMSTPRSEVLSRQAAGFCQASVIWHIGGGTIMCYAGTKRRPPAWIHTVGIEWIHRFYYERHTRKRYLVYGIGFVCYMAAAFVKSLVAPANQRPSTKRMQ